MKARHGSFNAMPLILEEMKLWKTFLFRTILNTKAQVNSNAYPFALPVPYISTPFAHKSKPHRCLVLLCPFDGLARSKDLFPKNISQLLGFTSP